MSTNLKSPLEGLKNTKCKKGMPPVRLPIPYVPPADLHKKQKTEQIKVELPNGTKFQMPIYGTGNNEEYLIHIITVLRLVEQKGTAAKVKEAFTALIAVRKEMSPLFEFPDNKTRPRKKQEKRSSTNSSKPSKPRKTSLLWMPRRLMSCSVALSLARRKHNGIGLSTRCTQRMCGLA
jgi:hypothetical protein